MRQDGLEGEPSPLSENAMDELLAESRIRSKLRPKNTTFTQAFQSVMKSNSNEDLIAGFQTLIQIIEPLIELETMSNASGVERSRQNRTRTIFSQNCMVNNTVFCLNGQIEDLIIALGFTASEIGNPDLKPDFVFRHDESEAFVQLKLHNHTLKQAKLALEQSSSKSKDLLQQQATQCLESKSKKRVPTVGAATTSYSQPVKLHQPLH